MLLYEIDVSFNRLIMNAISPKMAYDNRLITNVTCLTLPSLERSMVNYVVLNYEVQ